MPVFGLPTAMGEFAASRHGAFSRSQAAAFGLDRCIIDRLLREGTLRQEVPNVFTVAWLPETWRQRLMVATLACNEAGVAGYQPAAALAGCDCFAEVGLDLVLRSRRQIHMSGVRTHVSDLDDRDITEIDFIRCTTPERTLCDVASVATPFQVRAAFEWYWRTRLRLDELTDVARRLHRPGQSGTKKILQLLADAPLRGVPTASTLEVELEMAIDGIQGLVRQFEVIDRNGEFLGRPDFAVPAARLAIEAHSKQWHSLPEQVESDLARHRRLTDEGWRVRYVTKRELQDPARVRIEVERLIETGEVPPPYSPPAE